MVYNYLLLYAFACIYWLNFYFGSPFCQFWKRNCFFFFFFFFLGGVGGGGWLSACSVLIVVQLL